MGKRGKAKQGRMPNGSVPYGYRTGADGKPEIHEPEAEVVRRIFRQYVHEGMVGMAITRQLARDNAPMRRPGSQWHNAYVCALLGKEVYKGSWWYGKARWTATEGGDQVFKQPEDTWIEIPFPPLVDEQTWDRAQAIKKDRTLACPSGTPRSSICCSACSAAPSVGCSSPAVRRLVEQRSTRARRTATTTKLLNGTTTATGCRGIASPVPGTAIHQGRQVGGAGLERGQEGGPEPGPHPGEHRVTGYAGRRRAGEAHCRGGA